MQKIKLKIISRQLHFSDAVSLHILEYFRILIIIKNLNKNACF